MQEQIKNDQGKPIGYSNNDGSKITYWHYGGGMVGQYDIKGKYYTRFNLKLGSPRPMSNEDYGRSDVIALERMKNK